MGGFWVFPAPGQAHVVQQRHLRHWAENFQKVWYENFFEKFLEKLLSFPEIYFGHAGTISRSTVNRGGPHGFTAFSVQKNLISHF